ncbi:MAG: hypothetical protein GY849_00690 [Deltaproteobacteria bacterium]|nr:hypothetical protein [Deltaproteobacteria bacterium]
MINLLNPRFEVIADFPFSTFEIGSILDAIQYNKNFLVIKDKKRFWVHGYPNIFRKLNWWEHRTIEEMPKFLKQTIKNKTVFYNIVKWDIKNFIGIAKNKEYCNLIFWNGNEKYFPATKEEYDNYMN